MLLYTSNAGLWEQNLKSYLASFSGLDRLLLFLAQMRQQECPFSTLMHFLPGCAFRDIADALQRIGFSIRMREILLTFTEIRGYEYEGVIRPYVLPVSALIGAIEAIGCPDKQTAAWKSPVVPRGERGSLETSPVNPTETSAKEPTKLSEDSLMESQSSEKEEERKSWCTTRSSDSESSEVTGVPLASLFDAVAAGDLQTCVRCISDNPGSDLDKLFGPPSPTGK